MLGFQNALSYLPSKEIALAIPDEKLAVKEQSILAIISESNANYVGYSMIYCFLANCALSPVQRRAAAKRSLLSI